VTVQAHADRRRGRTPGELARRHVGWHRRHHGESWRVVVSGATWRECWLKLLALTGKRGEFQVLPEGQQPDAAD
jgi:hypothetical protein